MVDWIQTYTGKRFQFSNIKPDDICIEDIAHALALTNRFCGHSEFPYSVAQHSLHVSYRVPEEIALEGLLHDAHEAYCHDLTAPLKQYMLQLSFESNNTKLIYNHVQAKVESAIDQCFRLWPVRNLKEEKALWKELHDADMRALATEYRDLFPNKPHDWELKVEPYPDDECLPFDWTFVELRFLDRFNELWEKRK